MKKIFHILAMASLLTACEKTTVVPEADGGKDTTVVVPGAAEKKTENNTTIVNPAASEKKTESTTVVSPGSSSMETKTETTTKP